MYVNEELKSRLERMTGIARPSLRQVKRRIHKTNPRAFHFVDNNCIPNNSKLPFLYYRKVISLTKASDAAALTRSCLMQTVGAILGATGSMTMPIITQGPTKSSESPGEKLAYSLAGKKANGSTLLRVTLWSCRRGQATKL